MRMFACLVCITLISLSPMRLYCQERGGAVRLRVEARAGDTAAESTLIYENSYALLVGNSRYQNSQAWPYLPGVAEDIEAVRKVLGEQHGFKVEVAMNQGRDELLHTLGQFVSRYGQRKRNRLLIYYSGHGYTALHGGRKMGYLVMPDAPAMPADEVAVRLSPTEEEFERFLPSAVSMAEFENVEQNIQSDHVLTVFDSCFSGTAIYRSPGMSASYLITTEELRPARVYITAGSETQRVPDASVFRRKFVAGLMGDADTNGDGYILGYELWRWVSIEVEKETGRKQTPVYGRSRDDALRRGDIIFASPKGAAVAPYVVRAAAGTRDPTEARAPAGLDIVTAQAIFDRAVQSKDGSMQGQVDAIESLLAKGHEFTNAELSGISLHGARISKGVFEKAKLHAVDLSGAEARGADFLDSGLRFATLDKGHFEEAVLAKTYAPFLHAVEAAFEGADLAGADFFGSDFRGANFAGAKLRGTSFAFADLRGAKFDGADLTGAYLVGAILDDATFPGAVVDNTDFTGASAAGFALSQKQRAGACRHEHDGGFIVSLEQYPYNGRAFTYERAFFPSFEDRSLPLCATPPIDRRHRGMNEDYITLDKAYLSKAGREEAYRVRLREHVKLLAEKLTVERTLKGDDTQRKGWEAYFRNALKGTTPVSKPYVNTDVMLLALLHAGVLDEKNLNWGELASEHFKFERGVREDPRREFAAYSMWQPIFPQGVVWRDLPADKAEAYKGWVMARLSKAPSQFVVKTALGEPERGDERPRFLPLSSLGVGQPIQYRFAGEEKGISAARGFYAPYSYTNGLIQKAVSVVYAFPDKVAYYRLELPEPLRSEKGLEVELELKVEKFDSMLDKESSWKEMLMAFVFVTPGGVRLLRDGRVVWSGRLQTNAALVAKDTAEAEQAMWNRIGGSRVAQDFRKFPADFPDGANAAAAHTRLEQLTWDSLRAGCDEAALKGFLKEFPDGTGAPSARAKIAQLAPDPDAPAAALRPGSVRVARLPKGESMCFAWVPPGRFLMGSPPSNAIDRQSNERPQHAVTIREGFWAGQYEVTQAQYMAVMGGNPSYYKRGGPNAPIENVSWDDASEFVRRLNETGGEFEYRLPSEAEWEYAARAGTATAYAFGDQLPPSQSSSRGFPEIGTGAPNAWGLYDMHGGVSEWTEDIYRDNYDDAPADGSANLRRGESDYGPVTRVRRGGAVGNSVFYMRSASRFFGAQDKKGQMTGFRLLLKRKPRGAKEHEAVRL